MNMNQLGIALYTILHKEIRRFMRIWPQTLLPPAITMSLYFVIFGNLVGSRIGEMGGHSYMEFIVPGLIMMAVITNSYANVSSSFFSSKFQKSIEELIMSPVPLHIVLWGHVLGGVTRGVLVAIIVSVMSLFFADLSITNWFVTIYTVLITSLLFSLGGFINAVYAKSFDDISIIPTFVLTPLTYLGGVFYAISALGPFWQNLSLINPVVYMVNAFRYGILGHSDVNVAVSLTVISLCCAALYMLAYHLLSRGSGMRE
ncbi:MULTISPECIES: ABC transporter permease [unclassified Acinetobacter]|uniref:ABC transporter permease n=1 Tax=unclassified Acinetobacter TaxID=196816 RepID=UPI00116861F4|nr:MULTISPECIES: ABC transporter permease [unclassified Acinetobacter]MDM1780616.1 ABC transporter permease [Acinetobacter indicus]QKQ69520.1 ABC transporter permease [Acinetobacter sp. 10FS3-1]TQR73107.1 ABC transporter permease [Acinetobacter sp. RF14B]